MKDSLVQCKSEVIIFLKIEYISEKKFNNKAQKKNISEIFYRNPYGSRNLLIFHPSELNK